MKAAFAVAGAMCLILAILGDVSRVLTAAGAGGLAIAGGLCLIAAALQERDDRAAALEIRRNRPARRLPEHLSEAFDRMEHDGGNPA
jgi:hypothetical protein